MLGVLAAVAVFAIPGVALGERLLPAWRRLDRWCLGLLLALTAVPTGAFAAAWALGRPMSAVGVLSAAALLTAAARPRWRRGDWRELAAVATLAAVLVPLSDVRGVSHLDLFEPCLHASAQHMAQPDDGWVVWSPDLGGWGSHHLRRPPGPVLGIGDTLNDQRPFNGAVAATALVFAGAAAFPVLSFLWFLALGGAAAAVARPHTARAARVGAAVLIGCHGLAAYMVNESVFAAAAGLGALALTRPGAPRGAAGWLLGAGFGARTFAALWALPLALRAGSRRGLGVAIAGAGLAALPWLAVPGLIEGNPLFHPRPEGTEVLHQVLGQPLSFRPLNWPLYEAFVRPAEGALPAVLELPLRAVRSTGVLLAAVGVVGWGRLLRTDRRRSGLVLAWVVPPLVPLVVLVGTDYEKASWLLLTLPVMPWLLAAGLEGAVRPRAGAALAVAVGLAVAQWGIGGIDRPEDPRDVEPVEANRPRMPVAPEAVRAQLRRPRLLPSLQPHPRWRQTLATLVPGRRGPPLPVLYTTHPQSAPLALRVATHERPQLPPDVWATGPDAWSATREERWVLLLRGPLAETVGVRLAAGGDAPALVVSEGQQERWLTLVIDGVIDDDGAPPVPQVRIGGQGIDLQAWGYATRVGGEESLDVRIVSNVRPPHTGAPREGTRWGRPATWEPVRLRPEGRRWVLAE